MLQVIAQSQPPAGATGKGDNSPVAAAEVPDGAQMVAGSETNNADVAAAPTEFQLPADVQQVLSELGELTQPDAAIAADGSAERLPDENPLATTDADPEIAQEAAAEQWLLSMLGQQSTQISARDITAIRGGGQAVEAADTGTSLPGIDTARQAPSRTGGRLLDATAPDVATPGHSIAAEHTAQRFVARTTERLPGIEPVGSESSAALNSLPNVGATPATDIPDNGTTPANSVLQGPALERSLRLHGGEAKWGEQLLHALRDNVDMQLQQRVQNVTIRLDPPELGSMEIFLSHESGRLSVHISATQGDVARLLQHTSERLRQELVGQNFMHVSVDISGGGQRGQQHAQQGGGFSGGEAAVMGNQGMELPTPEKTSQRSDILVTV